LLGFYGNDFIMLLGCVVLFSIALFVIVLYIDDKVRSRCAGEEKWKFWGRFKLGT